MADPIKRLVPHLARLPGIGEKTATRLALHLLNGPKANVRELAATLLEEGMSIAAELGMPPLMERIAALQELVDAGLQASPTYPNRLTQREVEVLLQLSRGKTNREIARELVLSERTVQRHISNLYAKINVRNRAEATTFALSQLAP